MSLFSVQARKHTAFYDLMSTSRTPGPERKDAGTTPGRSEATPGDSACEDSRVSNKSQQANRTYVVSALATSSSGQQTPQRGRLTLQRRSRRRSKTGAETTDRTVSESSHDSTAAPEKRLTLQRRTRTRTPSTGQRVHEQRAQPTHKVLSEPNGRVLIRSMSGRETPTGKGRETGAHVGLPGRPTHGKTPTGGSAPASRQPEGHTFRTPTKKTPFEKISARRDVFEDRKSVV